MQAVSPAQLVAGTLYDVLSTSVTDFTYVDFCAGAGGPTPFIEQDLNAKLRFSKERRHGPVIAQNSKPSTTSANEQSSVKFVLTDLHPNIPDWVKAVRKSDNLSFVSEPVDAANAPNDLIQHDGKKTFRLLNLAFHHFDDDLALAIMKNTLETAEGFG